MNHNEIVKSYFQRGIVNSTVHTQTAMKKFDKKINIQDKFLESEKYNSDIKSFLVGIYVNHDQIVKSCFQRGIVNSTPRQQ